MKYVSGLDGLRALACFLVIVLHYGYFSAGWVGVQLFFVLSGFLITRILLENKPLPLGQYLKSFYLRRALRIFPLYFGVLVVALLVDHLCRLSSGQQAAQWATLFTYTFNWYILDPHHTVLLTGWGHFWSLAVEEQFYLVWPFLLYAIPRARMQTAMLAVIVGAFLLRLVIAIVTPILAQHYGMDHVQTPYILTYYSTFTQVDAFAIGGLVATGFFDRVLVTTKHLVWALMGVVVMGGTIGVFAWTRGYLSLAQCWQGVGVVGQPDLYWFYVYGFTALNLFFALLILAAKQGTLPFFSHPWLTRVGIISYGIYVFHNPLLLILRHYMPVDCWTPAGFALFLGYCLLLYLISLGSYNLFERYFLLLKDKLAPYDNTTTPASLTASTSVPYTGLAEGAPV